MKKVVLIAVLVLVIAGSIAGWAWYTVSHVTIDGHTYEKSAEVLDVRQDGLSPDAYDALCAALPECEILWELPFQGGSYPLDTKEIAVTALTQADTALLERLAELKSVDASAVTDWEAARDFARNRPDVDVLYLLPIGSDTVSTDLQEVVLHDVDAEEAAEKLPELPNLKFVRLEGDLPDRAALEMLQEGFPNVEFTWTVSFRGTEYRCDTTELNLADTEITVQELASLMGPLLSLEQVDVCGVPLPQEEMLALTLRYPDVFFLWEPEFFGQKLRTDMTEIDISGTFMEDVTEAEAILPYFPRLSKLVMCDCGVDNDVMDAFNRRHEDVQIVWNVFINWKMFRTDITWFMPFRNGVTLNSDNVYNLRYCTELQCIDIGHADVDNCEWAAFMPHLKYLLLGDTPISDISPLTDRKELIYLEIFKTYVKDYSPLLTCTALEDLNLGYTYGDAEIIAQMTWLKNLYWHRPTPPWGGPETETRLHLGDILKDAHVDVSYKSSSTSDGWRELPNYYAQRDILGMFYMEG